MGTQNDSIKAFLKFHLKVPVSCEEMFVYFIYSKLKLSYSEDQLKANLEDSSTIRNRSQKTKVFFSDYNSPSSCTISNFFL